MECPLQDFFISDTNITVQAIHYPNKSGNIWMKDAYLHYFQSFCVLMLICIIFYFFLVKQFNSDLFWMSTCITFMVQTIFSIVSFHLFLKCHHLQSSTVHIIILCPCLLSEVKMTRLNRFSVVVAVQSGYSVLKMQPTCRVI